MYPRATGSLCFFKIGNIKTATPTNATQSINAMSTPTINGVIFSETVIDDNINNYEKCSGVITQKKSYYGTISKTFIRKNSHILKNDNLFMITNNYSEYYIKSKWNGFILYIEIKDEQIIFYVLV